MKTCVPILPYCRLADIWTGNHSILQAGRCMVGIFRQSVFRADPYLRKSGKFSDEKISDPQMAQMEIGHD